jgi:DNA (cytosine-5)-methyltransferase 1
MKVVDLFSGCGGLSLGLQQAGYTVLAAYDNWDPALAVYRENLSGHAVIKQDLSDVEASAKSVKNWNPDMIAGGPPCQDFSSAGTRNHLGARADLTYRYADIVCEIMPTYFLMENVERIRKSHVLLEVIGQFARAGYGLTAVVLDASYCGAPQARLRFFLIGHLGAKNQFLLGHLERNLSPEPMTMRDYFGTNLGTEYYYRHPRNYNRRGIYGLDEPSATIRGVNRPIPPGYVMNANDPQGISLEQVRPLTTSERAQVQTFPPSFRFLGPKTAQEQMIGNAVPVALGKFVGQALMDYLEEGSTPILTNGELFSEESIILPERPLRPMSSSVVARKA